MINGLSLVKEDIILLQYTEARYQKRVEVKEPAESNRE